MSERADGEHEEEPLGYQHFLYQVNIEYNLGGARANTGSNCLSFRLKCLPYMLAASHSAWPLRRKGSLTSSEGSACDDSTCSSSLKPNGGASSPTSAGSTMLLDVTKQTCAFLGNSQYVPRPQPSRRRVVLEIISAKLSQPDNANSSAAAATAANEQPRLVAPSLLASDTSFRIPISPARHRTNIVPPLNSPLTASSGTGVASNKRFVNYTLLIKTVPGLDRHPAVVERRFSDFLFLYRGLKAKKCFALTVDKHVVFPRKVYMGNFSLHNIAERSLEFSKLLTLCMTNTGIMWSKSFVSFILDKELKEAHRLSLAGDLDELQALIEIPHRIVQKLFLKSLHQPAPATLPNASPTLANHHNPPTPSDTLNSSSGGGIAGLQHSYSETSLQSATSSNSTLTHSELVATCDTSSMLPHNYSHIKGVSPSLNERLLVIFCILFFTYYQSKNYTELKQTLQEFSSLISSQAYLDSLAAPRHYTPLRACLTFLINLREGSIMEDSQRACFAKKLEDLDELHRNSLSIGDTSSPFRTANHNSRANPAEAMVKALRNFDWNLSSDTYDL